MLHLKLGELDLLSLGRVLGKVPGAEREVTRGALASHGRLHRGDADDSLGKTDEEKKLLHRAIADERVVRLHHADPLCAIGKKKKVSRDRELAP